MQHHELRPYQIENISAIKQALASYRSCLFILPTGGGKSIVAREVLFEFDGRSSMVLSHRRELVDNFRSTSAVCSTIQSEVRRPVRSGIKFIIIDEAHHVPTNSYKKVLERYPDARVLGLSATPYRLDGTSVKDAFQAHVMGPIISYLISKGYLSGYSGFSFLSEAPKTPSKNGDYIKKYLEPEVRKSMLYGNIVEEWRRHCGPDKIPTICFCVSIAHAMDLLQCFNAVDIPSVLVTGKDNAKSRAASLAGIKSGRYNILLNCEIATEGFDIPELKCVILARPTLSRALYLQMVGRVLRPYGGQVARIHDHSGCISEHGLPDGPEVWDETSKPRAATESLWHCPQCYRVFRQKHCSFCRSSLPSENTNNESLEFNIRSVSGTKLAASDWRLQVPRGRHQWKTLGKVVYGKFIKMGTEARKYGTQRMAYFDGWFSTAPSGLVVQLSRRSEGDYLKIQYMGVSEGVKKFSVGTFDPSKENSLP